jgi:hypothetical protein
LASLDASPASSCFNVVVVVFVFVAIIILLPALAAPRPGDRR